MNKTAIVITGILVTGVLWFQQMEIQSVHEDVQEIKQFIIKGKDKMKYTSADVDCLAKSVVKIQQVGAHIFYKKT